MRLGIRDRCPVVCEPYLQWVLEDAFVGERPPLEDVGVTLVDDVRPYEQMKLRMLNAAHQAVGFGGLLLGHEFVHQAVGDPVLRTFLVHFLTEDAAPTVDPAADLDLALYRDDVLRRFGNSGFADPLVRLCGDPAGTMTQFVLPIVRDRRAGGGEARWAAVVIAACAVHLESNGGDTDPLTRAARRQGSDPRAFLAVESVFGDLARDLDFVGTYTSALQLLRAGDLARALTGGASVAPRD